MGAVDRTQVHFGMVDHSGESSGTILYFDPVAVDGTNWDSLFTDVGTSVHDLVKAGIVTMTKLNMTRTIASIVVDESAGSLPSEADAQREWAIRFVYIDLDNSNKKYSFTVPAPTDAVVPSGTDVVNLANITVAAFVTLIETYCKSPDGGDIEIVEARLIGRNS